MLHMCRGYLAPEYLMWGQLSEKADVYSFGVLLLEIVSGRQSIDTSMEEEEVYLPNLVSFIQFLSTLYYHFKKWWKAYGHLELFFLVHITSFIHHMKQRFCTLNISISKIRSYLNKLLLPRRIRFGKVLTSDLNIKSMRRPIQLKSSVFGFLVFWRYNKNINCSMTLHNNHRASKSSALRVVSFYLRVSK